MTVLILEDNLMWSSRLTKSVQALGHEARLVTKSGVDLPSADLAIVNLGSIALPASEIIPRLRESGMKVVAHAGHKEKELHALGRDLGCDRLVTNSELTYKLEKILSEF